MSATGRRYQNVRLAIVTWISKEEEISCERREELGREERDDIRLGRGPAIRLETVYGGIQLRRTWKAPAESAASGSSRSPGKLQRRGQGLNSLSRLFQNRLRGMQVVTCRYDGEEQQQRAGQGKKEPGDSRRYGRLTGASIAQTPRRRLVRVQSRRDLTLLP